MIDTVAGPGDAMVGLVDQWFGSPWIYLVSALFCAVDAVVPLVPSETVVITSGVYAAAGRLSLPLAVLVAALGAFVGDSLCYALGRRIDGRLGRWLWRTPRRRAAHDWAKRALDARGGVILVVGRFVPGGRTATTLAAGAVGYPRRRFLGFAALAALAWGAYAVGIGVIGGTTFEREPWKGVLLGLGLSLASSLVVELLRRLGRGRRESKPSSQSVSSPTDVHSDSRAGVH